MHTVFYIEDDALLADLLGQLLRRWTEIRYLGASHSPDESIAFCRENGPDIVLLDLVLGETSGFKLIDPLYELRMPPRILVFTSYINEYTLFKLSSKDIAGILWKSGGCEPELRAALNTVAAGGNFFSENFRSSLSAFRSSPTAFYKILSPLQQSLIPLFAKGLSDREIANFTSRRESTVKWHRRCILSRLGLHHTPQLMMWAREKGFIIDGPSRIAG